MHSSPSVCCPRWARLLQRPSIALHLSPIASSLCSVWRCLRPRMSWQREPVFPMSETDARAAQVRNKRRRTSQFKGVSKAGPKWKAAITANGAKVELGRFDTELQAAQCGARSPPKGGVQVDLRWPWAAAVAASHGCAWGHSGPWCCSVQFAGTSAHASLRNTGPATEPVW